MTVKELIEQLQAIQRSGLPDIKVTVLDVYNEREFEVTALEWNNDGCELTGENPS